MFSCSLTGADKPVTLSYNSENNLVVNEEARNNAHESLRGTREEASQTPGDFRIPRRLLVMVRYLPQHTRRFRFAECRLPSRALPT